MVLTARAASRLPPQIEALLGASGTCRPGPIEVLAAAAEPSGVFVVRCGGHVVKVHGGESASAELRARLDLAAGLPTVFLHTSRSGIVPVDGRILTVWPWGAPVDPAEPEGVPWGEAAALLATLHGSPLGARAGVPAHQMPASVADALGRLSAVGDRELAAVSVPRWARSSVLASASGLPAWALDRSAVPASGRPAVLTHGDWHLGQMVRIGGGWRLIDVDSLGVGDPAWDLARPAMWVLAGILDPVVWEAFLMTYREARGPALADGDPWEVLEPFARAAAVQAAASAMARAVRDREPLDEVSGAFLEACRRIAARGA